MTTGLGLCGPGKSAGRLPILPGTTRNCKVREGVEVAGKLPTSIRLHVPNSQAGSPLASGCLPALCVMYRGICHLRRWTPAEWQCVGEGGRGGVGGVWHHARRQLPQGHGQQGRGGQQGQWVIWVMLPGLGGRAGA